MQSFKRYLPKITISLAGVALIVLAVVVLIPSPSPAQPVITWEPESLNETVMAGETKTVSVSFTASEDLGVVEVRVVPALEPFVRTEPTSFPSLTAGQPVDLNVIIPASDDVLPQTVNGTIQIRNTGRPPRNLAQPLPVTVTISARDTGLPPDPGEAGKATLEGIDSDNDGVRDDIQRYIALTYPDSERTRAALIQQTKADQAFLLETGGRDSIIARAEDSKRAFQCLYFIRPDDETSVSGELTARLLNTNERSRRWIANDAQVSGHVFRLSGNLRAGCNFDVENMEN